MTYLTNSFWKFGHDCKWDQLIEPQHTHLILNALGDEETMIQYHEDGNYTLYGRQEALLVIPQLLTTKLLLSFYNFVVVFSNCRNTQSRVIQQLVLHQQKCAGQ